MEQLLTTVYRLYFSQSASSALSYARNTDWEPADRTVIVSNNEIENASALYE